MDTDDILAPHTLTKAPSNGSDCVLVSTGDKGPKTGQNRRFARRIDSAERAQSSQAEGRGFGSRFPLQVFSPKS